MLLEHQSNKKERKKSMVEKKELNYKDVENPRTPNINHKKVLSRQQFERKLENEDTEFELDKQENLRLENIQATNKTFRKAIWEKDLDVLNFSPVIIHNKNNILFKNLLFFVEHVLSEHSDDLLPAANTLKKQLNDVYKLMPEKTLENVLCNMALSGNEKYLLYVLKKNENRLQHLNINTLYTFASISNKSTILSYIKNNFEDRLHDAIIKSCQIKLEKPINL